MGEANAPSFALYANLRRKSFPILAMLRPFVA